MTRWRRWRLAVFALLLFLPVPASGSGREVPRAAVATDAAVITVRGSSGSAKVHVTCAPVSPSWLVLKAQHTYASGSDGETQSFGSISPLFGGMLRSEPSDPSVGVAGSSAGGGDRTIATTGSSLVGNEIRFVRYSFTIARSGTFDAVIALATFGGDLGDCTATANGVATPVTPFDPSAVSYEELGRPASSAWVATPVAEASLPFVLARPLRGGTAIAWAYPGSGPALGTIHRTTGAPAPFACAPGQGLVCSWAASRAARLDVLMGAASFARPDGWMWPPMLYLFDIPAEALG